MIRRENVFHLFDDLLQLIEILPESFVSLDARKHFYQAKKETLLGIRAVTDDLLELFEKEQDGKTGSDQSRRRSKGYGQKIDIEE